MPRSILLTGPCGSFVTGRCGVGRITQISRFRQYSADKEGI